MIEEIRPTNSCDTSYIAHLKGKGDNRLATHGVIIALDADTRRCGGSWEVAGFLSAYGSFRLYECVEPVT